MIRIGLMGYGNLARGVESAVLSSGDMVLKAVFTRRDPSSVRTRSGVKVLGASRAGEYRDEIDVMVLCGGSAADLPEQTPRAAAMFDVVDSFDTHARVEEHFRRVDEAARGGRPRRFDRLRMLSAAVLPRGKDYTFWGRGVSQGHSDAVRRIPGVRDARQYTVPVPEAVEAVRAGNAPLLSVRQKHTRECYVVLEEGADPEAVREAIVSMLKAGCRGTWSWWESHQRRQGVCDSSHLLRAHALTEEGDHLPKALSSALAGYSDWVI